jgi:GNAT superfamily N-acetyltransferase
LFPSPTLAAAVDLPAIQSCASAAYAQYIPEIGREPAPMVADFATQIAQGQVWVLRSDAQISGFIVFYPRKSDMFLENVAVCPEWHGKGVGKRLIAFCEATARDLGLARVCLYTNAAMTRNLSLYPHLGYRETNRRTEDGFHRVFFEKTL